MEIDRPDLSREIYNFLIKIGQITPGAPSADPVPTQEATKAEEN